MMVERTDGVFFQGERQAFIAGQEHGREHAVKLLQILVASVAQKYEKEGDAAHYRAAMDIADILFNHNWGLNGEKPAMPPRPDLDAPPVVPPAEQYEIFSVRAERHAVGERA